MNVFITWGGLYTVTCSPSTGVLYCCLIESPPPFISPPVPILLRVLKMQSDTGAWKQLMTSVSTYAAHLPSVIVWSWQAIMKSKDKESQTCYGCSCILEKWLVCLFCYDRRLTRLEFTLKCDACVFVMIFCHCEFRPDRALNISTIKVSAWSEIERYWIFTEIFFPSTYRLHHLRCRSSDISIAYTPAATHRWNLLDAVMWLYD